MSTTTTAVIDDFANRLSAGMSGMSTQDYIDRHQDFVANLDKLEALAASLKITDRESFRHAHQLKGAASSLTCFVFNNKLPEDVQNRTYKLEGVIGKKMHRYMMRGMADSYTNLRIRYLLWGRYYPGDEEYRKTLLRRLHEKGLLYVYQGVAHVTGIYCKIGDNVFTVGRDGKEYRTYVHTCIPQAFPLSHKDSVYALTLNLPELNEADFTVTWMQDGKWCARKPKLTAAERRVILKEMNRQ